MDERGRAVLLGMNRYQWTVLLAAWLGWGFDIFDGLLFTFVAPNCIPTLLHLTIGSEEAAQATFFWNGILTALLLLGWAAGGILFGKLADHLGRTRTLTLTILTYSLGTALCAFAPNLPFLVVCRLLASLGIGGEWAAGASMVAEVVPKERRVEAGALLYTSAPLGLYLASFVNLQIAGHLLADSPETSWRYVFLAGLIPAAAAVAVRWFVHEPEAWRVARAQSAPPRLAELFTPAMRPLVLSGFAMALTALLAWWTCNAFLPVIAPGLAQDWLAAHPGSGLNVQHLKESWKSTALNYFNLGGLLGTLLTVPLAKLWGRRSAFAVYFLGSSAAIAMAFGWPMQPEQRLFWFFPVGLTVFGVFGMFTYYLPELFPTRLRATGSGFCYNAGRVITAAGPFLVGWIARTKGHGGAMAVLTWVALIPLAGTMVLPWVVETKDRDPDGGQSC